MQLSRCSSKRKHSKADIYASSAEVWVKCKHEGFFFFCWKHTFIDGKHVGYHSKQWSIFCWNLPDSSKGAGSEDRNRSCLCLFIQSCGLMSESNMIYWLFIFQKSVVLKGHNGFSSPNAIHSEIASSLLVRQFPSNPNILGLKKASKSITFNDLFTLRSVSNSWLG